MTVMNPQTLDEIYRYIIVNDLGAPNPADITLGVLLLAMGAAINDATNDSFVSFEENGSIGAVNSALINAFLNEGIAPATLITTSLGQVPINQPIILGNNQSLFGFGTNFKQGGAGTNLAPTLQPGCVFVAGTDWNGGVIPSWAQTAYGLPSTVDALIIFAGTSSGAQFIGADAGGGNAGTQPPTQTQYCCYVHGTDTLHHGCDYVGGSICSFQDDTNLPGALSTGAARANLEHCMIDNDSSISIDIESVDWKIDGGRIVNGFKIFNGQGNLVSNVHLTGCPGGAIIGGNGIGTISFTSASNVVTANMTALGKVKPGYAIQNLPASPGNPESTVTFQSGAFVGTVGPSSFTVVNATGGPATVAGSGTGTTLIAGGGRFDSISTFAPGISVIPDPNISAADAGSLVVGKGIPMPTYVGTVIAGTSFTLVNAVGATVTTTTASGSAPSLYIGFPANCWTGSRMGFSNCQYDTVPITAVALVWEDNTDTRGDQITYTGCRWHENNANMVGQQVIYRTGTAPIKITGGQVSADSPTSTWASLVSGTQAGDAIDVSIPSNAMQGTALPAVTSITSGVVTFASAPSPTLLSGGTIVLYGATPGSLDGGWEISTITTDGCTLVGTTATATGTMPTAYQLNIASMFPGSTPDPNKYAISFDTGTVLSYDAGIIVGSASTATAGSATLPAAPVGFLEFDNNGTIVKVPYYST